MDPNGSPWEQHGGHPTRPTQHETGSSWYAYSNWSGHWYQNTFAIQFSQVNFWFLELKEASFQQWPLKEILETEVRATWWRNPKGLWLQEVVAWLHSWHEGSAAVWVLLGFCFKWFHEWSFLHSLSGLNKRGTLSTRPSLLQFWEFWVQWRATRRDCGLYY